MRLCWRCRCQSVWLLSALTRRWTPMRWGQRPPSVLAVMSRIHPCSLRLWNQLPIQNARPTELWTALENLTASRTLHILTMTSRTHSCSLLIRHRMQIQSVWPTHLWIVIPSVTCVSRLQKWMSLWLRCHHGRLRAVGMLVTRAVAATCRQSQSQHRLGPQLLLLAIET